MDALNPTQKAAAEHTHGPLLIVAGAGSGKTRTLTARLGHLIASGVPAEHIIAITFTNKAAREMAARVFGGGRGRGNPRQRSGEPFIGTFHSLGARILRNEGHVFGRTAAYTIFDDDDTIRLIKRVMANEGISRDRVHPIALAHRFSRLKSELGDPGTLLETERIAFNAYEAALLSNNAFDFDDLLEKVVVLFIQHPPVLAAYRDRFRFILVDEFQDVNAAQYQFVKLLAEAHRNLAVVGDDAQSIYGFRGADFRNFLHFEKDWPEARVVLLEQNYRSSGAVVRAASALIAQNTLQRPKELWTENPTGNPIAVVGAHTPDEEAEWIGESLLAARRDRPSRAIAILYRTNAQSRPIEQSLIVRDLPYRIFGGVTFYERREVKDIIAGLRIAANPKDSISRERITKAFRRAGGAIVRELTELGGAVSPAAAIAQFLAASDYFSFLERAYQNADERKENISELIAFAGGFSRLDEFLERVSLLMAADEPARRMDARDNSPPIHLMSIHLAKGLEFDEVYVAGVSEGLLPHHRSLSSLEELEEERRLLYVAMTRARHNLTLAFSRIPSRFLYELPPELVSSLRADGAPDGILGDEDERFIELI